jgi:hypothetical protein
MNVRRVNLDMDFLPLIRPRWVGFVVSLKQDLKGEKCQNDDISMGPARLASRRKF